MVRVLFDCDDVIVAYCDHFIARAVEKGWAPPDFTVEKMTSWSIAGALDLSHAQEMEILTPEFMRSLPPLPEAIEGVKRIAEVAEVHFVTSHFRGVPEWVTSRDNWLIEHFGENLGKKVHHTHHKYAVAGDVFVDDKMDHVLRWHEYWPDGYACLWDRPGNRNEEPFENGCYRMHNWYHLYQIVRRARTEEIEGTRAHFRRIR